ncbi:MAG: asparagine synthase (glutamine-hydrolyzing) [Clostridiales bacterium]|jgi:asparagine synthase (glutamine-hydrolysing)|nr:asparagine synthase (glutamine-hydrolyzing) [Clostridiales bacterium]
MCGIAGMFDTKLEKIFGYAGGEAPQNYAVRGSSIDNVLQKHNTYGMNIVNAPQKHGVYGEYADNTDGANIENIPQKHNGDVYIAGISPLIEQIPAFKSMRDALARRGPDQRGIFIDGNAALIHTRLSVVDAERGAQPMRLSYNGEDYCMVYNGELYNTEELRRELLSLGHVFSGHSDTEVLLHCYAEFGGDYCVEKLNGIFAFAVFEKQKNRLFFARDRIGVKPFFYCLKNGVFVFASEIQALLRHPLIEAEADAESFAEIICLGPGRTPGCGVFRGVKELKSAHCGTFGADGLKIRKYWSMTDGEHTDNFTQTVEKVRFLVVDAIERQLVSDVPVCTFLSGGLDSSAISAIANSYFTKRGVSLHTFSVDYEDNQRYFKAGKFQPDDDKEYIDYMTEFLGAKNRRVLLDAEELADALCIAVDARGLPGMADVDASLLLFCREIKKFATVALSGECADEIFGGYPWFRDKEIRAKNGFPWSQSTAFRAGFLKDEFAEKINSFEYVNSRYNASVNDASVLPKRNAEERRMKEMINLNFDWFMQTLLDRKDRMSMYWGLEVRVPFCDYRIAEYMYSVPWEMKDFGGREKGLLREALRGILPERILARKKSPYPKTHNPAYLSVVSKRLREIIENPSAPIHHVIKKEALERLLKNENSAPWYGQLMTAPQTIAYFLQFNYWLEKFKVRIV